MIVSMSKLTSEVKAVLMAAQDEARALGHGYIGTEHVLVALLTTASTPGVSAVLAGGVTVDGARAAAVDAFEATGRQNPYVCDADALRSIGIDADAVRARVEAGHGKGTLAPGRRRSPAAWGGCSRALSPTLTPPAATRAPRTTCSPPSAPTKSA